MKKLLLLLAITSFSINAQTIIFEDDFESYTVSDNVGEDTDIPANYTSYDVDNDGYNWGTSDVVNFTQPFSDIYLGKFIMSASYISTGAGGNGGQGALTPDNILVFPMISIPANALEVELKYLVGSGTDPNYFAEKYSVQVTTSSDQADILAATPIFETTLAFQGAEEITLNLDDYVGQEVYISFRHFDTEDMHVLGIDNFKVQHTGFLSVADLQNAKFSYYPNPVTNTLNLKADLAINKVSIFNVLGQEVLNANPNKLQLEVDFSNLESGIYTVKAQIGNEMGTFKIIKK